MHLPSAASLQDWRAARLLCHLIGVGVLLGELRRRSGSWPIAWIGHLAYNTSFLFVFPLVR